LLKRACDRIDPQGGNYDAAGHSPKYGFGRLNARTAVELAKPQPQNAITISRRFDAPIPDLQTVSFALDVPDNTPVERLTVTVDLKHTFIGDLIITLKPPVSTGVAAIVLTTAPADRPRSEEELRLRKHTAALVRLPVRVAMARGPCRSKTQQRKTSAR